MRKYFFIDFDNTIFSHRTYTIPDSAYEALDRLKKEGHMFILSSGRPFRPDSADLEDFRIYPDGFISANGAIVAADGKILHETFIDTELQNRLFDYILEKNYCIMARYEDKWFTSNMERILKRMLGNKTLGTLYSGEDFLTLYGKPMRSFFLADSPEAIDDVEAHFPEMKLLRMGADLGGADIIPKANSKAAGMSIILEYYGASLSDAIAIGDSMNDLEMIQKAGYGIAMGNAMDEVKQVSDYVTTDINKGGLSHAIDHVLRQKTPHPC